MTVMSSELRLGLLVFAALLAISMAAYWSASRKAEALHRTRRERLLTSQWPVPQDAAPYDAPAVSSSTILVRP
jgi:hypothetical protein